MSKYGADYNGKIGVGDKVLVATTDGNSLTCQVKKIGKRISVAHWSFDKIRSFSIKNVTLLQMVEEVVS